MHRSVVLLALIVAGGALLAPPVHLAAAQADANAAKLDIALKTDPSPAAGGADNKFEVTIKDAQGKAVTDADVSIHLNMPMPNMPPMNSDVKLKAADGKYTGTGQLGMSGTWNVTVTVKKGGKDIGEKKLTLTAK
jgi:nitrogen fixation protein FixH